MEQSIEKITINVPENEYFNSFQQAIDDLRKGLYGALRQRDLLIKIHRENHPDCEECTIHKVRDILYNKNKPAHSTPTEKPSRNTQMSP